MKIKKFNESDEYDDSLETRYQDFIELGMNFGTEARAEDRAGSGVQTDETKREFKEYFRKLLNQLNEKLNKI